MEITKPILPPKKGYVEVEIDGVRTYKNVETGLLIEEEIKMQTPDTPAEWREQAYNTEAIVLWDEEFITVTAAAQLWQYYAAEGSPKAEELQNAISTAKSTIREKYPDNE